MFSDTNTVLFRCDSVCAGRGLLHFSSIVKKWCCIVGGFVVMKLVCDAIFSGIHMSCWSWFDVYCCELQRSSCTFSVDSCWDSGFVALLFEKFTCAGINFRRISRVNFHVCCVYNVEKQGKHADSVCSGRGLLHFSSIVKKWCFV